MRRTSKLWPLAAAWVATAWSPAFAAEPVGWPQLGGPLRNGVSPVTGVFGDRPVRLRELWRRPVEEGLAGIVVAGDHLITLGATEDQAVVFAIDAGSGKELWRRPLGPSPPEPELKAASTPATDGRHVFVLSPACRLLALETEAGTLVWERNLQQEFDTGPIAGGCSTSPLLEGDLLVVQVNGEPGKRVVAFDKSTGAVRWAVAGAARAVQSSPGIMDLGGVRQLVVHDIQDKQGGVYGLRLADGALLWSVRFEGEHSYSYETPIPLSSNRILIHTWRDLRALQVRNDKGSWRAEPLWTTPAVEAEELTGHAVVVGDHVYGMSRDFLACLDAATGKVLWKQKTYTATLSAVDGHLLLLSQVAGLLRVIDASPGGYREKASREVFNPGAVSDTPPIFAGDRIFVRNLEEMVALAVER